jgi:YHS domain-containing protein
MMRFGCGAAGGPPWSPPAKDTDPVCGMTVETKTAKSSVYDVHVYYFCSQDCRQKFDESPVAYVTMPQAQHARRRTHMNTMARATGRRVDDTPRPARQAHAVPVVVLGMGLSVFLVISYILCVLGYLLFPALPIEHSALAIFLPGLTLLSWQSFFLGLAESFAWGWYVALVFGPIYNFFSHRVG